MANEDLVGLKTHCTICGKELVDPKPRQITCGTEDGIGQSDCAKLRIRLLRKKVDDRECRFCHKASTPTQRKAFARFRKWEREHPDVAYPEAWGALQGAGMNLADFGKAVTQAASRDIPLDSLPEACRIAGETLWWGSAKTEPSVSPNPRPMPELERAIEILKAHCAKQDQEAIDAKARAKAEDDAAWEAEGARA